jgi:hypothetical protein
MWWGGNQEYTGKRRRRSKVNKIQLAEVQQPRERRQDKTRQDETKQDKQSRIRE